MDLREQFEAALRADPYDQASRNAYADFLMESGLDEEAEAQRAWTPQAQRDAEAFMREYLGLLDEERATYGESWPTTEMELPQLLDKAREHLRTGRATVTLGFDTPDFIWYRRRDFWKHFTVLTGVPVQEDQRDRTFFRCAC